MVNYPLENRLAALEEKVSKILELLEATVEEEVCAHCDGEVDFDSDDPNKYPEWDMEERLYLSGATEKVRLLFHASCNAERVQETLEMLEKQEEDQARLVEENEWRKSTGQPLIESLDEL